MTFKQKFKILSLLFTITSVVCLILPNIDYQDHLKFNVFELLTMNKEFHFPMLLFIVFVIGALGFNLASISYDKNKVLPIITLSLSLLGAIFAILIKYLTIPGSGMLKENWLEDAKVMVPAILIAISLSISFILNTFITIRTFVLKQNDDDYVVGEEIENDESWDVEDESEENEVDDLNSEKLDLDSNIIDDFKEK